MEKSVHVLPNRFKKLLRDNDKFDKNRNLFHNNDPFNNILSDSYNLDFCKECQDDQYLSVGHEQETKCNHIKYDFGASAKTHGRKLPSDLNHNTDFSKTNSFTHKQQVVDSSNQGKEINQNNVGVDVTQVLNNPSEVATGDNGQGKCTDGEIFQALGWIRDQILLMKEEDKILMQQFLDLRARIRNLKSHLAASSFSMHYNSDISASHLGIDEACEKTFPMDLNLSPNQEEDYLGEFRERTVSMHLVQPKKVVVVAKKTIRKYRTEEYL